LFGNVKQIITTPTVLVACSIGLFITAANESCEFDVWCVARRFIQIAKSRHWQAHRLSLVSLSWREGMVAAICGRGGKSARRALDRCQLYRSDITANDRAFLQSVR